MEKDLINGGRTDSGIVVQSDRKLRVKSGCTAIDTSVLSGGHLLVSKGGVLAATVVSSGGSVLNGGAATDTTVLPGAEL